MEYCPHGDLLNFLQKRRDAFVPQWSKIEMNMEVEVTFIDLANAVFQITRGMEFLESKQVDFIKSQAHINCMSPLQINVRFVYND